MFRYDIGTVHGKRQVTDERKVAVNYKVASTKNTLHNSRPTPEGKITKYKKV